MFPSSANATRVQDYQTSTFTLLQQSIVHFTSNFAIHNHQKRHTTQQRRAFNSTRTLNTTRLNATKATSILTGFGWPDGPVRETGANDRCTPARTGSNTGQIPLPDQCTLSPDRRQYRATPIQGQPITPPASHGNFCRLAVNQRGSAYAV